jgi:glyoxylase-like metal-dependent hydrolase (beta-lactamase superfamily II)
MNAPVFPTAIRWFSRRRVDDAITLLWEPHVIELMRCNIWHIRGRKRDLLIDTGLGVSSLAAEVADLIDKPVTAVATHGHDDHIGSHHEFPDCVAHPLEADLLLNPPLRTLHIADAWGTDVIDSLEQMGYPMPETYFVDALPAGVTLETFRHQPSLRVSTVEEADVIDTGDRAFEVLHLPGHSPGSIGLWEHTSGTLFSGDAIYDGPLLDELEESNIEHYCATMRRLLELPVTVVHAGHDPSFGRERLREIARAYLLRRN